ncbi:ABC transporter ATP-binding protein [Mumia sp. DW29H23]|uniref:ABC transporter ATP-binding protein n=1 Tax=Mumia sp. DW29H23 TaxID=3421241 RepID=UPI003D694483
MPAAVDTVALATSAKNQQKSLRRLLDLVRRSTRMVLRSARVPFYCLVALQVVGAAALAAQVVVVKATLDAILEVASTDSGTGDLVLVVSALAALTALTAVVGSLQGSLGRFVGESVAARMWHRVLDVATGVNLRRFESSAFFDRLQRVQASALTRPYQVTQGVITAAGATAASIGLAVAIVALHPALLPLLVVGGLPLLLTSRRESRLEFDFMVAQTPRTRMRTYLTVLQTGRDEAKEVRAYGLAPNLRGRFDRIYGLYLRDLARHLRRRGLLNLLGNLGSAVVLALTLLVLVWLIGRGRISVAEAGAAIVAIRMLAGQVQAVFSGVQAIFESGLFLDDLDGFVALGAAEDEAQNAGRAEAPPFTGLAVRDVSFTYPGRERPAVDGVSLDIAPGEVVALVGENGSGKTTLAKLVAALYEPADGTVWWDDVDARTLRPDRLRRQIAVIFQDFVKYAFSAEDNIALGRADDPVDPEAVREAARTSGAEQFLAALPEGFQTPLNRIFAGGHDLSGGQWQRVALARAFYRDAALIVLDEPTSALDPRAEHELFVSLRAVLAGRSALFISHRFSTVRQADRIYVLEDGRVIEHGSHDELMALGGHYAELFRLQAEAYALSAD